MSLLCFSMDFVLTKAEEAELSHITISAYNAWVLVNDYFSWEKEWLNYEANGSQGEIVSAVFQFMKWYSIDAEQAKVLLREEIISRENTYCEVKEQYIRNKKASGRAKKWFAILDMVTAGNFAWSMTTARYLRGEDAYPTLRASHNEEALPSTKHDLDQPISLPSKVNETASAGLNGTRLALTGGVCEPSFTLPGVLLRPYEKVRHSGHY